MSATHTWLGPSTILSRTKSGKIGPTSASLIVESIRKLGFKPEEIKVVINGHAHSDHAGAFAEIKKIFGAQIAIMEA